jgi:F-type H+-transporting ATPase subunit delta
MHATRSPRLNLTPHLSSARAEPQSARTGGYLAALVALVAAHPDLARVFRAPDVSTAQKRAVLDAVIAAAGGVRPEVERLLRLLADRDRLSLVGEVADAFTARADVAKREIQAEVVTAVPLDAARQQAIADALGRAVGRPVAVDARVDPAIVGGVVAKVGSLVFDGSVTRQLDRLRERMRAGA